MTRVVYLKTTDSCNLNCKHCFTEGSAPERNFWNVEKTIDWIHRLMAHAKDDFVYFELHGGEPFLADVQEMRTVVSAIRSYGKRTGVGATSNLTFKLHDDLLDFIVNDLDGVGTSWDPDIRFANDKQRQLWRSNMERVRDARKEKDITLNVSVSRGLVQMDCKELLLFLKDTGAYKVQFERLTYDGNAIANQSIFPSNEEVNAWYLRLHEASQELGARSWFNNTLLESVYAKFEKNFPNCGTFCRDCEERLFTVSASGAIGGCPNSAPTNSYGHIDMSMQELHMSSKRLDVIVEERTRNPACYECPVFSKCGSDCHQLQWEGPVCPAPKQLMLRLAGLETGTVLKTVKKFIPIKSI